MNGTTFITNCEEDSLEPSDKLKRALRECEIIENEYKEGNRKGYNNVNEMLRSIIND